MMTTIESSVLDLITECKGVGVPESELEDMAALAKAGEPGIALENLCTQLFEYNCGISNKLIQAIETSGIAMGLKEKYWSRLRRLIPR